MKNKPLHTRPGIFSHFYPGGGPVMARIVHSDSTDKATIIEPEPRVAKLCKAWQSYKGEIPIDLEFETLELATELLDPAVIHSAITSGIVCDMTIDLLFDSLKLGMCPNHERSTSMSISRTLTEPHEPGSRLRPAVKYYEVPEGLNLEGYKGDLKKFILCWVSKPDGLRDIMLTMQMLYVGKTV